MGTHFGGAVRGSLLAASMLMAASTFAADTGGPDATPTCPRGYVYEAQANKCMPAKTAAITDESLYEQGRQLAKAGRYQDAIATLLRVKRQDDARVLNYLGYSHRKLGDFETGLAYYKRALAIDPNNTLVREYMGEAFVKTGKLDLAREQLREIERRCGTACEPYKLLSEEIAKAEKRS